MIYPTNEGFYETILASRTQRQLYSLECVKVNSQQVISTILHSPHLWERRMAHFSALELIAKHMIWEQ
jgi:hypothetical protein